MERDDGEDVNQCVIVLSRGHKIDRGIEKKCWRKVSFGIVEGVAICG